MHVVLNRALDAALNITLQKEKKEAEVKHETYMTVL